MLYKGKFLPGLGGGGNLLCSVHRVILAGIFKRHSCLAKVKQKVSRSWISNNYGVQAFGDLKKQTSFSAQDLFDKIEYLELETDDSWNATCSF